ncbi:MAG: hypothetical protein A2W93_04620 [Bacteroidetes bacterium GWF2_43_63]|nr:MAG: hypothetical protein A2W94_12610 [Bacteroidetes bacterium GWE2_42_42]OFY56044.1 MAG: hypothetical protein A2W93_04620 [Bacteroidetes bacterium GWF2_43_63]HBG70710.1 hypothetical protein [Bacteroidales bacterium]HCB62462.1 hypothetical protein [Bacteroidales bacterium]HCY21917.1 hypothetical protein [Bacteroidales bacterium]
MKILITIICSLIFVVNIHAQCSSEGLKCNDINTGWFVGVSGGQLLPYTDITSYNGFHLIEEFNEVSGGYAIRLGKHWSPALSSNIEVLDGRLNGTKMFYSDGAPTDQAFSCNLWALSADFQAHFFKLTNITNKSCEFLPFDFYGRLGAGAIFYRSQQRVATTAIVVNEVGVEEREIAFTYIFGFGTEINVFPMLSIYGEYSWYNTPTDLLDAREGITKSDDAFGSFMGGIKLYFGGKNNSLF